MFLGSAAATSNFYICNDDTLNGISIIAANLWTASSQTKFTQGWFNTGGILINYLTSLCDVF